jgi:hypothetical protein
MQERTMTVPLVRGTGLRLGSAVFIVRIVPFRDARAKRERR